ncbi:hypothetical protein NP233_g3311 [Leucocoprinus birnbaumii]|uniref:Trafficking protein particle complex subunit 11 C-terminal domain-containing protein n=1 Tax=Leucocoprinus birnbaumii TaxID=56174 RepID=A0AAD5VY66_9AGAR|nr:hypothetical protein NP233_g3311 [Leucocoprinus birnbaumii]
MYEDGKRGQASLTRIHLPALERHEENVIALLDVPTITQLHVPFDLCLSIRNCHPTLSANILCQLETDNVDAFVISGLRSGRLPILLPGAEERVMWRLIPMECGHLQLPRIKVHNRRRSAPVQSQDSGEGQDGSGEGMIVNIMDVRRGQKAGSQEGNSNSETLVEDWGVMTVLVRP